MTRKSICISYVVASAVFITTGDPTELFCWAMTLGLNVLFED